VSSLRRLVKAVIPSGVFRTIEPIGHLLEAVLMNIRYGFPARGMHVIGVTGTNGKTTTSFMIHRMLVEAGYDVALMSTVAYGVGNDITPQVAHMTTISSPQLLKRIRQFKKQGAKWLVLETTSHALAQHRVFGVPYEIAVMTNVTHEHLDYHRTFKRYVDAKAKLFSVANRHGRRFGVVNADDENAKVFSSKINRSVSYGINSGDIRASDIQLTAEGSNYKVDLDGSMLEIHCRIPGEFNVYNSLAAIAVGRELKLNFNQIAGGIAALEGVEGRMATVNAGQPFSVVVDFAHTPDSFERLLGDMRRATKGKLVVMFGSAGRRDESKRAIQGEIAGKYADEVVIAEEDDRDIDGNVIMAQIAEGAMRSGKTKEKDLFMILDRSEAIRFAVSRAATADDAVVLLGKGHEKTIERADGEHPWDETAEVKAAIAALLVKG
jgi:UDP-N-acetylmuramoyl-L-alanyl-D-glutamate--2,6-diaminopimelate ligase